MIENSPEVIDFSANNSHLDFSNQIGEIMDLFTNPCSICEEITSTGIFFHTLIQKGSFFKIRFDTAAQFGTITFYKNTKTDFLALINIGIPDLFVLK